MTRKSVSGLGHTAWWAALVLGIAGVAAEATPQQGQRAGRPTSSSQERPEPSTVSAPNSGIVSLQVSPDSIATIRTAQGVVTRVALPAEASEAICGDLYDPATNTGSFIITKSGTDVFIKPMVAKGATNLFIKTAKPGESAPTTVFNFDVLVVPPAQAYRVVNVNLPSYMDVIDAEKEKARREMEAERQQMQAAMQQQLDTRVKELEAKSTQELEAERKRLSAEADRRADEIATRRVVDGILQGFNGVSLVERRGRLEQAAVELDSVAYTFEGKLFVRYRIQNEGSQDLVYREPRVSIRTSGTDRERPVQSSTFTSRGELTIPAGQEGQGVVVFERPRMQRGDRVQLTLRAGNDSYVQFRLLEQDR
jgi:Skp family chaperone for outer membrane proteins